MFTVRFKCPKCRMHNICGLRSLGDICAFRHEIPIPRSCGACGVESLVIRTSQATPPTWDRAFALCLKIAATCRRLAREAKDEDLQRIFLKMETAWLDLGARSDADSEAAIVAGRSRRVA
jgi:hypothetical protein